MIRHNRRDFHPPARPPTSCAGSKPLSLCPPSRYLTRMLCEASVGELKRDRLGPGHVVVCMRHYPRFLKKELKHEYLRSLAPDDALFDDFRAALATTGDHNEAFRQVHYEQRFFLTNDGLKHLARLADVAKTRDVYLVCQCDKTERCHRHLLLLAAAKLFAAPIDRVRFDYPEFEARIADFELKP